MNNLIEAGFVISQFLLFVINYKWMHKKTMHPAVIYSFIWFVILFLHLLLKLTILRELYDVSTYTFIFILAGTISFCIGSFLISILREKREKAKIQNSDVHPKWLRTVSKNLQLCLLIIVLSGLPIYIYKSYQIFLESNIDNFLIGLRTELSYGGADLGPIKYLASFSYFAMAVQQYCFYKHRTGKTRFYFIISTLCAVIIAIFTTGRGPILWVFSILLGINYLQGKKFSIRYIVTAIFSFFLIFSIIGILLQKGGSLNATLKENIEESGKVTGTYLVASINGLDIKLHDNTLPDHSGDHSLRFFKLIGRSIGISNHKEIGGITQLFVFVPYSTNVYTIYNTYYSDFGIFYALFIIALLGLLHTIVYYKAMGTKNIRYSIYFSMLIYPLLMSFFQDTYFSIFSTWIQIIVFTELLILINRVAIETN